MNCKTRTIDSPVGKLILAASGEGVAALAWSRKHLESLGLRGTEADTSHAILDEAERQLGEYFRGERTRFDLEFELNGTEFQVRVWNALKTIPYGKTWSYRELAVKVGSPEAVRAVGTANGRNPVSIFIPCHRVVRLNGEMGGYAGGIDIKTFLLDLERNRR
jgi:methylated-DNA-[protein]-cysteine S-methyltransferase